MILIRPEYTVLQAIGSSRATSAIHLARLYGEPKRNFRVAGFLDPKVFVTTVGWDAAAIRDHIGGYDDAEEMLIKAKLVTEIADIIGRKGVTHSQAARVADADSAKLSNR